MAHSRLHYRSIACLMEFINNRIRNDVRSGVRTLREEWCAGWLRNLFIYLVLLPRKINVEKGLAGSLGVFQLVLLFFTPRVQTHTHIHPHMGYSPSLVCLLFLATFHDVTAINFLSHNRIVIYCSRLPRRAEVFLFGSPERDFHETSRKRKDHNI